MEVVTKLKCEHCNRRVNWNVLIPVNSHQIKVRCPYCDNEMIIDKQDINQQYHEIIFGGQNDYN